MVNYRAWLVVFGGFCIHLVLGTLYCWANITSAVTSYLRLYDSDITYNKTLIVYASSIAMQGACMMFGGYLQTYLGARYSCLLGGYVLVLGVLVSSAVTELAYLIFTYGILFGIGLGLCYTAPIVCAVRWFPTKSGLVTGIIVGGFGCGAFVFGYIASWIVNPNNLSPDADGYYPPNSEVVARVPKMFEGLAFSYFILITIGCLLLREVDDEGTMNKIISKTKKIVKRKAGYSKVDDENVFCDDDLSTNSVDETLHLGTGKQKKVKESKLMMYPMTEIESGISMIDSVATYTTITNSNARETIEIIEEINLGPRDIFCKPLCWHVTSCLVTTTVGGMYIVGTFKTFGQSHFNNELFLTTITSLSSISNLFGRIFWGYLGDRYGAIRTLTFMSIVFAALIMSYHDAPLLGKTGYALWTFAIFFCEGGNFVLYVPITVKLFGSKQAGSNYGLIFSTYTIFVVSNLALLAYLDFSFNTASILMAFLTCIGFFNLIALKWHIQRINLATDTIQDSKTI